MRKRSLEYVERSPLLSIGEPLLLNDSASTYIKRDLEERSPINGLTNSIISSACSCFVTRPTTQTIQATVTSQVTVAVTTTATSLTTTYTTTTLAAPTATVTLACKAPPSSFFCFSSSPPQKSPPYPNPALNNLHSSMSKHLHGRHRIRPLRSRWSPWLYLCDGQCPQCERPRMLHCMLQRSQLHLGHHGKQRVLSIVYLDCG
jgi:hypothetical protein